MEIMHFSKKAMNNSYAFLVAISLIREDFPWVYELGKDLFDMLKSNKSRKQKEEAIYNFREMLEFSLHTVRYDKRMNSTEDMIFLHEIPMMLMKILDGLLPNKDIV
jgi:hypothetical protein